MLLMILIVKKFLEPFIKTNNKKQIKKNLEQKTLIETKRDKLYVNSNAMITFLVVG